MGKKEELAEINKKIAKHKAAIDKEVAKHKADLDKLRDAKTDLEIALEEEKWDELFPGKKSKELKAAIYMASLLNDDDFINLDENGLLDESESVPLGQPYDRKAIVEKILKSREVWECVCYDNLWDVDASERETPEFKRIQNAHDVLHKHHGTRPR